MFLCLLFGSKITTSPTVLALLPKPVRFRRSFSVLACKKSSWKSLGKTACKSEGSVSGAPKPNSRLKNHELSTDGGLECDVNVAGPQLAPASNEMSAAAAGHVPRSIYRDPSGRLQSLNPAAVLCKLWLSSLCWPVHVTCTQPPVVSYSGVLSSASKARQNGDLCWPRIWTCNGNAVSVWPSHLHHGLGEACVCAQAPESLYGSRALWYRKKIPQMRNVRCSRITIRVPVVSAYDPCLCVLLPSASRNWQALENPLRGPWKKKAQGSWRHGNA